MHFTSSFPFCIKFHRIPFRHLLNTEDNKGILSEIVAQRRAWEIFVDDQVVPLCRGKIEYSRYTGGLFYPSIYFASKADVAAVRLVLTDYIFLIEEK